MTDVGFGSAAVRSGYTVGYVATGGIGLPTGRTLADGSAPAQIIALYGYVSGRGAARGVTMSLGSAAVYFTAGASSSAQDTGWLGTNGWLVQGGTATFRYDLGGQSYFGRSSSSGGIGVENPPGAGFTGVLGGNYRYVIGPTAPTIGTFTQVSPVEATLTWSAPSDNGGAGVTGYVIEYATNASYTSSKTVAVGAVLSHTLTGLTPGTQVFARVAASNQVTTAKGTTSIPSASASVILVADIGDLDGWTVYGTLPGGLTALIGTGLRRGSVYPLGAGAPTGLLREVQQSGTGGPVTAAALGIQRTFPGLKIGTTYKLDGTVLSLQDTTPSGNIYRWSVTGIGTGSNATTSNTTTPVAVPSYMFVATATSHVVQLQLNEAASWSGSGWFEAVALYGMTLTEIPNTSPYRLQDVALESSLANHFTIACDTVGAAWWVDRSNVTQFRQVANEAGVKATFTDRRAIGAMEYTDIAASYDTRNTINSIKVTNHGRDAGTGNTKDVAYTANDSASITAFGARSGSLDMEMRSAYVDATNLIANPSGEVNATGYAAGTGMTVSRQLHSSFGGGISGTANEGSYFIRHAFTTTVNNNGFFYTTYAPVTPGKTYTWSAWFRSSKVQRLSPALQYSNSTPANPVGAAIVLAANVWTYVSQTVTIPGVVPSVGPYLYSTAGTGYSAWVSGDTLDIDCLMFEEATTPSAYFDGSSADSTGDFIYAYTGTPHASSSTRTNFKLINDRIREVLTGHSTPEVLVSRIRWNAQENPALAAALEIQDRVRIEFRNTVQLSRIVGIKHELSGDNWIIEMELVKS